MNYYKKYTPYLFLLPAVAVLIVFFFIPFFQTFGLSFFDYSSSIYNPTFNGVDNYIKLILDVLHDVVYDDDKNVVGITAEKYYSTDPRIELDIKIEYKETGDNE